MNRSLMQVAALIFTGAMELTGIMLGASPGSPEAESSITIHVYNYARIPAWRLARTQKQVSAFFLLAGIQLKWVDCAVPSENEACPAASPWSPDPADLVLKIVPRFDVKAEGMGDAVFGFAAGSQITIINERTEEIAKSGEVTHPLVLGITIAHELGHALLGPNSHSETGIMRPRFLVADFTMAQTRTLTFTPEQAEQMRRKVSELKNRK